MHSNAQAVCFSGWNIIVNIVCYISYLLFTRKYSSVIELYFHSSRRDVVVLRWAMIGSNQTLLQKIKNIFLKAMQKNFP